MKPTNEQFESDAYKQFSTKGYFHYKGFFSLDHCSAIIQDLECLEHDSIRTIVGTKSVYLSDEVYNPAFHSFAGLTYLQKSSAVLDKISFLKTPRLLRFSSWLLGVADAFFSEDEIHIRQPLATHSIPSHQDNFYFALERPLALTCYVYLTAQSMKSGSLGFLPASIDSATDIHDSSHVLGFSSYNQRIESQNLGNFEYPETSPGDVIFHHCNTYHRANSNETDRASVSASIRVFSAANIKKSANIHNAYLKNIGST